MIDKWWVYIQITDKLFTSYLIVSSSLSISVWCPNTNFTIWLCVNLCWLWRRAGLAFYRVFPTKNGQRFWIKIDVDTQTSTNTSYVILTFWGQISDWITKHILYSLGQPPLSLSVVLGIGLHINVCKWNVSKWQHGNLKFIYVQRFSPFISGSPLSFRTAV